MIELKSAVKAFAGTTVIDGIDLLVRPSRTTVLIGPSGCGKSTLLRMMLGLVPLDSGSVSFDGAVLTAESVASVRRRVGYVIQEGGLFPHMTARENVTVMAKQLAWPSARIEPRLGRLLDLTDFPSDALDRYPVELSGGQRQRVALMRALMLDPDVLLLDEPLGALDPMIRFDLQTELREIFDALKKTAVLVTHDLSEAAYFGEEIVLLRDGRIVQRGTLAEMLEQPADPFVTRFVSAQRRGLEGRA